MAFPVDEKYIKEAENRLGVTLPRELRTRLGRQNGGEWDDGLQIWFLHPVLDSSDKKRVARSCNDICRETATARQWRGFPENAVCIAHNDSGDLLLLLPAEDDEGRLARGIYHWNHETAVVSLWANNCGVFK